MTRIKSNVSKMYDYAPSLRPYNVTIDVSDDSNDEGNVQQIDVRLKFGYDFDGNRVVTEYEALTQPAAVCKYLDEDIRTSLEYRGFKIYEA